MNARTAAELIAALVEAGIDRRQVYVTNVVKHFRWEPRGKRAPDPETRRLETARFIADLRVAARAAR